VETVLYSGSYKYYRPLINWTVFIADLDNPLPLYNVIDLILSMRLLWVGLTSGEDIKANAQNIGAYKLMVKLTDLLVGLDYLGKLKGIHVIPKPLTSRLIYLLVGLLAS
jgi:hypothetical protein